MYIYNIYSGRLRWADDDENVPQADDITTASAKYKNKNSSNKNKSCDFKVDTLIPSSPDGSYTPPPPDETLLRAIDLASTDDYNNYCSSWDEVNGFEDKNDELEECGLWQQQYISLHEQRLEQLQRLKAGDFESFGHEGQPKYVSYLCETDNQHRGSHGCGGLADRMNGKYIK